MVGRRLESIRFDFRVTVAILWRGRTGWEIGGGGEAKVGCGMDDAEHVKIRANEEGK